MFKENFLSNMTDVLHNDRACCGHDSFLHALMKSFSVFLVTWLVLNKCTSFWNISWVSLCIQQPRFVAFLLTIKIATDMIQWPVSFVWTYKYEFLSLPPLLTFPNSLFPVCLFRLLCSILLRHFSMTFSHFFLLNFPKSFLGTILKIYLIVLRPQVLYLEKTKHSCLLHPLKCYIPVLCLGL